MYVTKLACMYEKRKFKVLLSLSPSKSLNYCELWWFILPFAGTGHSRAPEQQLASSSDGNGRYHLLSHVSVGTSCPEGYPPPSWHLLSHTLCSYCQDTRVATPYNAQCTQSLGQDMEVSQVIIFCVHHNHNLIHYRTVQYF